MCGCVVLLGVAGVERLRRVPFKNASSIPFFFIFIM